jgi:uncharacterized protein
MISYTGTFKSAPWCLNGHTHTVLSSLLFSSPALNTVREKLSTPDDDFLYVDILESTPGSSIVVLFHGLEGHSRRYYITQLAQHLHIRGFTILAVNFRSCSGKMNKNKKFYHSGETEDLQTVFEWVKKNHPSSKIFAAGFSLGGSAILNYLKKHRTHHPIFRAAVISTPFDLKKGSLNLEVGINRFYSIRFLRTLKKKVIEKRKSHPDLPKFDGSTLYDFDDTITGPIHGFEGADHYYSECSSRFFMDQIVTPTLVVHSKEDPMCPFKWTPVEEIMNNPKLTPCFTSRGGHVGFWSLPPGWLNRTIGDYFSER